MEMGGLAERMVADAVAGLLDENRAALARVHESEMRVNELHRLIDDAAVQLTVTQQPVARDVRLVFVASRCAADVERIADQAVNIAGNAEHVLLAESAERAEIPDELLMMTEAARRALANALTAMTTRDLALAHDVLAKEPTIDELRDEVFKELLYEMIKHPTSASSALSLLLISRNLERIGDHATNIAEEVIYLVRGKDIRHGAR